MHVLARTTIIACSLTLVGVLALTLFVTRVIHLNMPPDEFAAWTASKKEAYLDEHRAPTLAGFELLKVWAREPAEALPYVAPEAALIFSLSWVAAFLGGIWQRRRP